MANKSKHNHNTDSDALNVCRFESGLLSRKEAAAYLGVSVQTLAIWHCTGRNNLKMIKIGKLAKYRRSDLDEFIASREVA